MNKIKSFEDACLALNVDATNPRFSEGSADEIAYLKLKVITRALNEGWVPDWNNSSERKWTPIFWMNDPGFRFWYSSYDVTFTYGSLGSRLCFKSEALSDYAAGTFLSLYQDFLVIA